jgi:hypothetical protein
MPCLGQRQLNERERVGESAPLDDTAGMVLHGLQEKLQMLNLHWQKADTLLI